MSTILRFELRNRQDRDARHRQPCRNRIVLLLLLCLFVLSTLPACSSRSSSEADGNASTDAPAGPTGPTGPTGRNQVSKRNKNRRLAEIRRLRPSPKAIRSLVDLLQDPDADVRFHALARLNRPMMWKVYVGLNDVERRVATALDKFISGDDIKLQRLAVMVLHVLTPNGCVPRLARIYGGHRDETVRLIALESLLKMKNTGITKSLLPQLIKTLQAEDVRGRVLAVRAIRYIAADATPAVPALSKLLEDEREWSQATNQRVASTQSKSTLNSLGEVLSSETVTTYRTVKGKRILGRPALEARRALIMIGGAPVAKIFLSQMDASLLQLSVRESNEYARILAVFRGQEIMPELTKRLADPDETVQATALRAVAYIGPAAAAVIPRLQAILQDEVAVKDMGNRPQSFRTRGKQQDPYRLGLLSLRALQKVGGLDESLVPLLTKVAVSASRSELRIAAIQSLAAMGRRARAAAPVLLEILRAQGATVEQAVAQRAAKSSRSQARRRTARRSRALQMSRYLGVSERVAALQALVAIDPAEDQLVQEVHRLVKQTRGGSKDPLKMLRVAAIRTAGTLPLDRQPSPRGVPRTTLEEILHIFVRPRMAKELKFAAGPTLSKHGVFTSTDLNPRDVQTANERLEEWLGMSQRQYADAAVEAMAAIGGPKVQLLIDAATKGLAGLPSQQKKSYPRRSRGQYERNVKSNAIKALGRMGGQAKRAVPLLCSIMKAQSPGSPLGMDCLIAIGRIGAADPQAVSLIQQALQDKAPQVRIHAAAALQRLKRPAEEVVPTLEQLILKGSHAKEALDSIIEMGQAGVPILRKLVSMGPGSRSHYARLRAAAALRRLSDATPTNLVVLDRALQESSPPTGFEFALELLEAAGPEVARSRVPHLRKWITQTSNSRMIGPMLTTLHGPHLGYSAQPSQKPKRITAAGGQGKQADPRRQPNTNPPQQATGKKASGNRRPPAQRATKKPGRKPRIRNWVGSAGRFKVRATLLEIKNGQVKLRKPDGRMITVPLRRLSRRDQDYLKKWKQ